eukprot:PhM_4_TR18061/c0_g1_i1/m.101790
MTANRQHHRIRIPRVDALVAVLRDAVQNNVSWVKTPELKPKLLFEVRLCAGLFALIARTTAGRNKKELVKGLEDLNARLVDHHGHGDLRRNSDLLQSGAQLQRRRGIEASRGLVQEDRSGGTRELKRDAHALTLSAVNAAERAGLTDHNVPHLLQAQRRKDALAQRITTLRRPRARQTHLAGEPHVVRHAQLSVHHVVLRHEADQVPHVAVQPGRAVDRHAAAGAELVADLAQQRRQEDGLAGAGRAHDGRHGAGADAAGDTGKQLALGHTVCGGDDDIELVESECERRHVATSVGDGVYNIQATLLIHFIPHIRYLRSFIGAGA